MQYVERDSADVRSNLEKLYNTSTTYGDSNRAPGAAIGLRAETIPTKSFLLGLAVSSVIAGMMSCSLLLDNTLVVQAKQAIANMIPKPAAYTYGGEKERAISAMQGIPGMQTEKSVITGVVDPVSLSASYYWTLVLKNTTSEAHEAQFEIALPKGAAVSRATLWINEVPQEAAFNSTERVSQAYHWITVRHRDPLLVTQIGSNRILVKASPVQAGGQPMQLRLGITAPMGVDRTGQAKVMLPHIVASNTAVNCQQDVHLEAPVALYSSEPSAQTSPSGSGGSVLRANTDEKNLNNLTITATRPWSPSSFATRATHSGQPAYIVSYLQYDHQSGLQIPTFHKALDKPDCFMITNEDAAHRISTLWAASEIERLSGANQIALAVDVANAYRVVSPVSGATVLETESDYQYNSLNRDMNRSISYLPGVETQFRSEPVTGSQTDTFNAGEAPILQGATNGTIGPQAGDAEVIQGVNTAGTVRVNNSTNLNSLAYFSGEAGNWLYASARDANIFDGESDPGAAARDSLIALFWVITFCAWTFAGPATLMLEALRRKLRKQPEALRPAAFSAAWLAIAIASPSLSQFLFAVLAVQVLWKQGHRMIDLHKARLEGRRAGS